MLSGCETPRSPGSIRRTQEDFQPNYRTTAQSRLKRILKDYLAQSFMGEGVQMRLSSTLSNCMLKPSIYGYFTTSLARLFQWLIVLTIKSFFLIEDGTSAGTTCVSHHVPPPPYFPCISLWSESHCPISNRKMFSLKWCNSLVSSTQHWSIQRGSLVPACLQ